MKEWGLWLVPLILFLHIQGFSQSHDELLYEKGLEAFNNSEVEKSLEYLDKCILENSKNTDALYLRAYVYLVSEKKEFALLDYDRLLKIDHNHIGALTNRALIYMELEIYDEALVDLNTILDSDSTNWSIIYERGYCHGLKGDHNLAIADFSKVISLNPKSAEAYAQRGVSKINELSNEGLIRPAPEQCISACVDLNKAVSLGDTTLTRLLKLYCSE